MATSEPQGILELRHLRLVRAIAEEGGPTRAGKRLHLSQSAVSHQLAELERRLGVELFVRERRRLHLTTAGKRVVQLGYAVLPEFERAEREVRSEGQTRQRVRICTECFTGYHWLPMVLPQLRREFPLIDLSIDVEATRRPIAALLRGRLDLAVVSTRLEDPALRTAPLFEDEWVVITSPSHPLRDRPYIRPRDLSAHPVFAHHASRQDSQRFEELLVSERATRPQFEVVPLTEALVSLVRADLGVGLVSRWAVAPYERSGQIVVRRFTKKGLRERWSAAFRVDAPDPAPLLRLAELLRSEVPRPKPLG
ncbi:MAG: LysR family transcriptional regulator [Nannocystaceae bacterium]|nr:LysR family transcriptional regulator [Nannocystaceae bacterium]